MFPAPLSPEILPVALTPEMLPVALTPEMLPLAVAPDILPLPVAPEMLPLAFAPEILPLARTPEMLPAKVVEQRAQVRTDAQRIDLALFIVFLLVIPKRLLGKLALNWGIFVCCGFPILSLPLQITCFARSYFKGCAEADHRRQRTRKFFINTWLPILEAGYI